MRTPFASTLPILLVLSASSCASTGATGPRPLPSFSYVRAETGLLEGEKYRDKVMHVYVLRNPTDTAYEYWGEHPDWPAYRSMYSSNGRWVEVYGICAVGIVRQRIEPCAEQEMLVHAAPASDSRVGLDVTNLATGERMELWAK